MSYLFHTLKLLFCFYASKKPDNLAELHLTNALIAFIFYTIPDSSTAFAK